FPQSLNDAYREFRGLLTPFRLLQRQADLPSALREMLDTLQNQTSARVGRRQSRVSLAQVLSYLRIQPTLLRRTSLEGNSFAH
ncbi:hypothetical protein PS020_24210, partial [Shigella sonnei]|nr:hypothetical protein [Shigella sonnei]